MLATRTLTLLNNSELSRSSGIANATLKRYMTLLETTFLVQLLPPWSGNLSKRLVKSPKVMLTHGGWSCQCGSRMAIRRLFSGKRYLS